MNHRKHFLAGASKDACALIAVKLVTASLGFVLTRILAETLSISQFGTYSQAMLLVSTLSALTILGMIDGTNFFFHHAHSQQEKERYMSTIITMQGVIGIACASFLLLFSELIIRYFNNLALKELLLFIAVLPLMQNLISILQIMFVAIGKARQIAIRNLLVSVSKLILYVIACRILKRLSAILLFTILLDLAQILYFQRVLSCNGCAISILRADFHLVRQILHYCIPMAVFIMISAVSRDCDKYVISAFTDTDTLAVYSNASKSLPFDLVTSAYITVLVPCLTRYITAHSFEKARSLYQLLLEMSCITTAIMAFASIAAAPMLMELLYTQKYLSGIPVFVIYTLVDTTRFLQITVILSAAAQTKQLVYLALGSLVANLILNIILFHCMGIIGPAVATLVVLGSTGLILQKLSARVMHCKLADLFDLGYLLRFFAESLATMAVFLTISRKLIGLNYIVRLLVVGGGYGLVLLALNFKRLLNGVRQIGQFR